MPPSRIRGPFDESKSEASSSRDKLLAPVASGVSKARRNGNQGSALKDVTNANQPINEQQGASESIASVRLIASLRNFLVN